MRKQGAIDPSDLIALLLIATHVWFRFPKRRGIKKESADVEFFRDKRPVLEPCFAARVGDV